jgi:hypothetical protein
MFFCIHIFIQKDKADIANNPYLMVRSRSEYYTSMSVSGLPTFLILVENIKDRRLKFIPSQFALTMALNSVFSFIKMSDRDLKFVFLFCQTDTFLFVIETRKCKHPFSRNQHQELRTTSIISRSNCIFSSKLQSFKKYISYRPILDSSSAMTLIMYILRSISGADPGFQVRGGGDFFNTSRAKNTSLSAGCKGHTPYT